jgi:hypothetical protein
LGSIELSTSNGLVAPIKKLQEVGDDGKKGASSYNIV